MNEPIDVNFKDNDLPDLKITDYTKDTSSDEVKYIPKDQVNYAVLDHEGYPIEGAKADTRQVNRDEAATCKELSLEDSEKAVEALGVLSKLGLIEWRDATQDEDSLGIDTIGELSIVAHDGHCLSAYLFTKNLRLQVGKWMVRTAWGK